MASSQITWSMLVRMHSKDLWSLSLSHSIDARNIKIDARMASRHSLGKSGHAIGGKQDIQSKLTVFVSIHFSSEDWLESVEQRRNKKMWRSANRENELDSFNKIIIMMEIEEAISLLQVKHKTNHRFLHTLSTRNWYLPKIRNSSGEYMEKKSFLPKKKKKF